jgi:hypothetical protein
MADETLGQARVVDLLAKEAIREVIYRELDAWRRRDWAAARACYVPGARADLGFDAERAIEAQLELLADLMQRFEASTLLASNCLVALAAGSARSSTLVLAAHQPFAESGERTRLSAERAADEWTQGEDGSWRIASRRLETLWRAWLDPRRDDRAGDHRHAEEW